MPLHPSLVHFPIAMSFLLPVFLFIFLWAIRAGKMSSQMWILIVGLQLAITAVGYATLKTGEKDEDSVAVIVGKEKIQKHEEAAEIFVGTTVVGLVAGVVAVFIQPGLQLKVQILAGILSLVSLGLGLRTGFLGGEIVYKYGGANAHVDSRELLRPEPGTFAPSEDSENESLKADDNDYSGENALEEEKNED